MVTLGNDVLLYPGPGYASRVSMSLGQGEVGVGETAEAQNREKEAARGVGSGGMERRCVKKCEKV